MSFGAKSPKKPELSADEIASKELNAKIGKAGTAFVSKHTGDFIKQSVRDRITRAKSSRSADMAIAGRDALRKNSMNPTAFAKTSGGISAVKSGQMLNATTSGVADKVNRMSKASGRGLNVAKSSSNTALALGSLDGYRSMNKMHRQFKKQNDLIDAVGVAGGLAVAKYNDSKAETKNGSSSNGEFGVNPSISGTMSMDDYRKASSKNPFSLGG